MGDPSLYNNVIIIYIMSNYINSTGWYLLGFQGGNDISSQNFTTPD